MYKRILRQELLKEENRRKVGIYGYKKNNIGITRFSISGNNISFWK